MPLRSWILSDRDRRYIAKSAQDQDFDALRTGVEELFKRAIVSRGSLARTIHAKLGEVAEAAAWAKRSAPTSKEDLAAIKSIEAELATARRDLPTLNVDIQGLSEQLSRMRGELEKIAQRSLENNIVTSQQSIKSLAARKSCCADLIERLKQTMNATSGAGVGLVFLWSVLYGCGYGSWFNRSLPLA